MISFLRVGVNLVVVSRCCSDNWKSDEKVVLEAALAVSSGGTRFAESTSG